MLPVLDGLTAIKAALVRCHPHAIGHSGNMVVVDPQADDTVGVLSGNAIAVTLQIVCIVHVDTMPDASYELNMTWPVAYSKRSVADEAKT